MMNFSIKRKLVLIIGGVVTITPTVLVALLASAYYYLGIESFFNERVSDAISRTSKIAQLYVDEYKESVKLDALSVANNIDRSQILLQKPELLQMFLDKQAGDRGLTEIMLFTKNRVISRNSLGLALVFERLPIDKLHEAEENVVILREGLGNRIRAIAKLHSFFEDAYVLVSRYSDQEIINYLQDTKGSAENYEILLGDIQFTRNKLAVAFIILSAMLCFGSVIIAIKISNLISKPLEQLAKVTSSIKEGDFSVRVPERKYKDEITILAKAFNTMTERIAQQRSELVQANELIDKRRRFIEAILSELSTGVIATNSDGIITLCNNSAFNILNLEFSTHDKAHFTEIFPEISTLLQKMFSKEGEHVDSHIIINRNQKDLHLFVKIGTVSDLKDEIESIIITFNDITELVSAQRMAAWADIARRVAHEIKNPLTPIQLAAERMRKKYMNHFEDESDNFSRYIDTIIKNVTDIERMVVEFVEFARLPAPKMSFNNLNNILSEELLLQAAAYPSIKYEVRNQNKECLVVCDTNQISRVISNLLKNAAESIKSKELEEESFVGKIVICVDKLKNTLFISILDNGKGIDSKVMNRITEPYVTTKRKGTGLGLSIVKKIVEDHGSKLIVKDIKSGACFSFSLNIK